MAQIAEVEDCNESPQQGVGIKDVRGGMSEGGCQRVRCQRVRPL